MLSLPSELTHVQANACLAQLAAGVNAEGAVVALNAEPLQRPNDDPVHVEFIPR